MKESTVQKKLNELLGITTDKVEELASDTNPLKDELKRKKQEEYRNQPMLYGYRPDEFAQIRIMQGTHYFLQAPKLFSIKQCPICEEWFAVSRFAVGYCSYHCMDEAFKREGLVFRKGGDLEALADDPQVWNGNEPLWTIPLAKLKAALETIIETVESKSTVASDPENTESVTPSTTSPLGDSQMTLFETGGSGILTTSEGNSESIVKESSTDSESS